MVIGRGVRLQSNLPLDDDSPNIALPQFCCEH
jgi:hypothetical protein